MSTHISIKEASKILGLSIQHVRNLCRKKLIKSTKIGNSWVLDSSSVNRYGLQTSHKLAKNHSYNKDSTSKANKPIALSFFSGAMGLDLGIEKAGFDIRLACEIDKYCRQTIELNKPGIALLDDINKYEAKDILEEAKLDKDTDIDLIIGGPPCQAFSTAGKRKGFKDDRGNVFLKYLDLALELRPKYIVFENVRGLLSCPMDHRPHNKRGGDYPDLSEDELRGGALNFVLSQLRKAKYSYSFNLYNSANFGTPQIRERVIIVCSRDGSTPPFLQPTHSQNGEFGLKKWNTVRKSIKKIKKHHHINFPERRLQYYRMLGPGQNWRNLPTELQKEALGKSYYAGGGKTGFLRRLSWDKPSPTLVTHPAMPATDLAHPELDRPLSVEEYKAIQEFPDKWELAGPLVQQYKQIGNAVPLSLGHAVGVLIRNLLNNVEIINPEDFKYSRYRNTAHEDWQEEFKKLRKDHSIKKAKYG